MHHKCKASFYAGVPFRTGLFKITLQINVSFLFGVEDKKIISLKSRLPFIHIFVLVPLPTEMLAPLQVKRYYLTCIRTTHLHSTAATSKGSVRVNISIRRFSTTHAIPANDMKARVEEAHKMHSTADRCLEFTYSAASMNTIG